MHPTIEVQQAPPDADGEIRFSITLDPDSAAAIHDHTSNYQGEVQNDWVNELDCTMRRVVDEQGLCPKPKRWSFLQPIPLDDGEIIVRGVCQLPQ